MAKADGEMAYTIEDMKKLRTDKDMFFWLIDTFFVAYVGSFEFRNKSKVTTVSNILTVSDEAFILLCIENNFDKWIELYEIRKQKKLGNVVAAVKHARYTRTGPGNKGFTDKAAGWNNEGIESYNQLCQIVARDRVDDARERHKSAEYVYHHRKKNRASPVKQKKKIKAARVTAISFVDFDKEYNRNGSDSCTAKEAAPLHEVVCTDNENASSVTNSNGSKHSNQTSRAGNSFE